jgi:hypothetical protein
MHPRTFCSSLIALSSTYTVLAHRYELDRRHSRSVATICEMGRYQRKAFEKTSTPRWVAVFAQQWQVIESHLLEPASDLCGAIMAAIERLAGEGWQI